MKAIDARALNPRPEELTERRRARRIGKCALYEVHAGGALVHGTEQSARMAWDTNFEQEAVRQRLGYFLDPAFGEGRSQLLNNGTNFCRRERHYLYARPATQ